MTTQEIKQAGVQAVRDNYNCNGKYPCEERDYCIFCNGQNSSFDCDECGADDYHEGFLKAANWRINSVWHDASEHPITGEEALVKHITGDGEIKYRVDVFCGYEWKEMCHYDKLIQFAYVKDLIQNMEE